jgi:hypothetical protein
VATSTVYLFRNIGNVLGTALAAALLQNYLVRHLSGALSGVPNSDQVRIYYTISKESLLIVRTLDLTITFS